jgi:hypothetical protein
MLVADGPRAGRGGEAEKCALVRRILEQVDWDCDVSRNYSDSNMGCKKRVVSGLNWVFEQVEEAIILEDDCLPHPTFFRYCDELLQRYRDDERIMSISGDNFLNGWRRNAESYYFSRYVHIWGWASWKRAWEKYDPDMKTWPAVRDGGWLNDVLGDSAAAKHWKHILDETYEGRINTWDYQLVYSAWINNMSGVIPYYNMVSNIGFRPDATHTPGFTPYAEKRLEAPAFPLVHPLAFIKNVPADAITERAFYSPPRLPERIRRKLVRISRKLRGIE